MKKLFICGTEFNPENFDIVAGGNPCVNASGAAEKLAYYLKLTTGSEFEICVCGGDQDPVRDSSCGKKHHVFVGNTSEGPEKIKALRDKLTGDGILTAVSEGDLYLTGANARGIYYAVWTFLEDLGWRFYSSRFELLRHSPYAVAGENASENEVRAETENETVVIPENYEYSFSPRIMSRDTFWRDSLDAEFSSKMKINGWFQRKLAPFGGSFDYAGGFVHTLPSLAETSREPDAQPCLTDPAIYEKVLAKVRAILKENPQARIVSVSQNDSYPEGRGCQCENCRRLDDEEGTPMGSLLTFVNRIADDIKDDHPGVFIDTLAYRYTRKAPKHIKPRDNVIIRLCSIECCFSHPLVNDCERNNEFRRDIEEWSKICKNMFIWDYTTDFLYYLSPFPNLRVLPDNIRFFADHSAVGLFEQGNGQSLSGEFGELRAYLIARLMWDPDMSRERYFAYMDDFLEGYYGAGWKYIREYIDRVTDMAEKGHMGIYYPIEKILCTEDLPEDELRRTVAELDGLWEKALAAAEGRQRDNVEKSSMQQLFASLSLVWDGEGSRKRAEKLCELMAKYGITHYREGRPTPPEHDCGVPVRKWGKL